MPKISEVKVSHSARSVAHMKSQEETSTCASNELMKARYPDNSIVRMNSQVHRRKASSFRGVYRCGKKWKSQIQIDGVQYYLGVFPTEDRAAEEYRIAAKRLGKVEDSDFSNSFKEFAEGEGDADFIGQAGGSVPFSNTVRALQPLSSSGVNQQANDNLSNGRFGSFTSSGSISRLSEEENPPEEVRSTSFYLIPTNQLSLISSKVRLGKLGEEILALSATCEDSSALTAEENPNSNSSKLIALQNALFHSIQQIRNSSNNLHIQSKSKISEFADDETMYEV